MALSARALPTVYEYYASGPINSGLSVDNPYLTLNDKNFTLYSGAMHYFRIPRQYWRDRLRKLRAAGLNTVETYIPWNLHEPKNGVYDFGTGTSDYSEFLDLQAYLKTAQEEDLLVILRPGPYICASWEWGGLPSWLLKEDGVQVRTSETKFMDFVKRYFSVLLPLLTALQFINGGPIIGFQVENAYGSSPIRDLDYVEQLRSLYVDNGIKELLFSSDSASSGSSGTLPGVLFQTLNFGSDPAGNFDSLLEMQPGKPVVAMEFRVGWFDQWSEDHHTTSAIDFQTNLEEILKYPASGVNFYMFHGGTNFGFLNGATTGDNGFLAATSSYDYDAPLTEGGDYTEKYEILRDLINYYNKIPMYTPEPPVLTLRRAYTTLQLTEQMPFTDLLERMPVAVGSTNLLSMEQVEQSYGYIVYVKENIDLQANSLLTIKNYIHDSVLVLVNGELVSKRLNSSDDLSNFGYWNLKDSSMILTTKSLKGATLHLIVENWGRVDYGDVYSQFKGLNELNTVLINNEEITSWVIYPMDFKRAWNTLLAQEQWESTAEDGEILPGPGVYKSVLNFDEYSPYDSYLDMREWTRGIVIINNFVLGRYCSLGPQQTLYLPGPFLQWGQNQIIIFELYKPGSDIRFVHDPIYSTP